MVDTREVGERYGVADSELQALTDWLKSQNLHVDWVAPGKNFVGISRHGRRCWTGLPDRHQLLRRRRFTKDLRGFGASCAD